ncbi:hypothetical protein V5799_025538 [Amblyomma americanum]|uniref:Tick transposon n=1 Tax=Amblyomma americanum TaxID=6943 RepID=A0AAQ4E8Z8_AMBAM
MACARGKYRAKTLKDKCDILREVDAEVLSKQEIAKKHGIPKSTLSTYIKNKRAIEDALEAEVASERKRMRLAKYPDLEKALLLWNKEMRAQDIPLSGPVILAKAADFALRLGYDDVAASDGWLHRFRERYDLVFRAVSGEMKAVNLETCESWRSEVLQGYQRKYSPQDIFNADETGLFFKLLPAKTITYKDDKCTGGKRSKERVTVMVVANMTGSEKLPLFVVGKSSNPRCFKNIRSLPTDYVANRKAWMTGELFKQWLMKVDKKFERCGRKILLLVDNCSAHKIEVQTNAVELAFLPANTTAVLQPMDQGIIKNLKTFYRRHILERIILCQNYEVTLLSALHMLVRAWEQVTGATIANCYRHCGFTTQGEHVDEPPVHGDCVTSVTAPMSDVLKDVSFADYVDVDASAVVCGVTTDEDIISQVKNIEPVAASDDDEEDDEAPVRPSAAEVMAGLNAARLFFSFEESEEEAFRNIRSLEQEVLAVAFREKKQTTITDFFKH